MTPGDMPDFDPALKMAYDQLIEPERQLTTKHIIIISDGDPQHQNKTMLTQMRQNKVTVTTVGVATHGVTEDQKMIAIAAKTGGRFYKVHEPAASCRPSTSRKHASSASRFFTRRRFQTTPCFSRAVRPTDCPMPCRPLYGYVRTTPKQSPLVEMPIVGPPQPDGRISRSWPTGSTAWASRWPSQRCPFFERPATILGSRLGRFGHVFEILGTGGGLGPATDGDGPADHDHGVSRRQGQGDRGSARRRDGKKDQPLTDLILEGGITSPSAKADELSKARAAFRAKAKRCIRSGVQG